MRRTYRIAGLLALGALAAACGSAPAPAFHPRGVTQTGSGGGQGAIPVSATSVVYPPFGHNVQVVMPSWMPAQAGEGPAVITDKNFELALLYAEYRGGQDTGWQSYVSSQMQTALGQQLSQPDVTAQSFTGTIRFSHLSAFPDPSLKGSIDVSQCVDTSQTTNTSLASGHPVADHTPPDQHYYRTTSILARSATGSWQVTGTYQAVYYPRAPECKP